MKSFIKQILWVKIWKYINYLQYQLVIEFRPEAPVLQYHQQLSNSYCLSSLASAFRNIGDKRAATALSNCSEESLSLHTSRFTNRIDFVNYIMKKQLCHKGEHCLRYNMNIWEKGDFDILYDISKNFNFSINGLPRICESFYQYCRLFNIWLKL